MLTSDSKERDYYLPSQALNCYLDALVRTTSSEEFIYRASSPIQWINRLQQTSSIASNNWVLRIWIASLSTLPAVVAFGM